MGSARSDLVRSLTTINAAMTNLVGGKAANLGALIDAEFPVPQGFCLTTKAYARIADAARLDEIVAALDGVGANETHLIQSTAATIRDIVMTHEVPIDVVTVGDRRLDKKGAALVAASREAHTNAARFAAGSGGPPRAARGAVGG